jgi:hypothetical protein
MRRLLREAGIPPLLSPPPQNEIPRPNSWLETAGKRVYSLLALLIAIFALVELFPRPNAAAYPPSDPNQILNSRFTVSNDGYLQLIDFEAGCFVWKTNNPAVFDDFADNVATKLKVFRPSDTITVPCADQNYINFRNVNAADIAIVITYRPWPFTFLTRMKIFRFVSRKSGSTIAWDRQPVPVELEKSLNALLAWADGVKRIAPPKRGRSR